MATKNNTPTPTIEQIKAAYAAATTDESKNILRALYGEAVEEQDNRPITERVKTLEDAINILGNEHPLVKTLNGYVNHIHEDEKGDNDVVAFLKLRVIMAALNEGWRPDWSNKDEDKWFPWFWIYTKEEIEKMDEEDKPLLVGGASDGSFVGVSVLHAAGVPSHSSATFGGALASKTREIAIYAATQFGQLFAELILF